MKVSGEERLRGFEVAKKFEEVTTESGTKTVERTWKVTELPKRATAKAAGYDFAAAESVNIPSIWQALFKRVYTTHEETVGTVDGVEETKIRHKVYLKKIFDNVRKMDADNLRKEIQESFAPTLIHTGVKAYMLEDEVLELYNRSSNPKKLGLILANSVGIVDSDYYGNESNDGEIGFIFYNLLPWVVKIKRGDIIGQGIFKKWLRADNEESTSTERKGGFGSTD